MPLERKDSFSQACNLKSCGHQQSEKLQTKDSRKDSRKDSFSQAGELKSRGHQQRQKLHPTLERTDLFLQDCELMSCPLRRHCQFSWQLQHRHRWQLWEGLRF